MAIEIDKPKKEDIENIQNILREWRTKEDVDAYGKIILDEINGKAEFNMRLWIARNNKTVTGIIGLCDPLPKLKPFFQSEKPGVIKILYIHNQWQRQGIGKKLVSFIENEAKKHGYTELLVRSAPIYKNTAWGFYDRIGYLRVGTSPNKDGTEIMQVFYKKL